MYHTMCDTDVFVCGGGPAGLAAAIAARRAGFRVTVADPAIPPIDKACGEGIMPDGLAALQQLGITLGSAEGVPFHGIRFIDKFGTAEAAFPHGCGIGVRRAVLHERMVRAASEMGVALQWGVRVSALSHGGVCINGQKIRSRWLICADGQHSRLRALAGLSEATSERQRRGFRRHYRVTPWTTSVEVYWSDVGQMYVTPVSQSEVCVAWVTSGELRFDEALRHFPELSARLLFAEYDPAKGAITATRKLRHVQCDPVALVGEASGSVDAVTGEGLALAFQQAVALAEAMKSGGLRLYEQRHRHIMRLPHVMASLMLSMDSYPAFRRRVFRAFNSEPRLFSRLLALHTGALSPMQFGMRGTLSLAWRLVSA